MQAEPAAPTPSPLDHPDFLPAAQRARRDRILRTTRRLLASEDHDRLQIRTVAEESGVALGTLYRYFPSKDYLFAVALTEWSSEFRRITRDAPGTVSAIGADAGSWLRLSLRAAVDAFASRPRYFPLLQHLLASDDPTVRPVVVEFDRHSREVLLHGLGGIDPEDAAVVCQMLLGLLNGQLQAWTVGQADLATVRARLDRAVALLDLGGRRPDD